MKVILLAAAAGNNVIGRQGDLPWRLSSDLKRFKADTMGKPIIMGRKTWESFPKRPLPGRRNIVISRSRDYHAEGGEVTSSLDEALALAQSDERVEEICVIGGGEIFVQAMRIADVLKITHVLADMEGDTFFPPIDPAEWRVVSEEWIASGEKDSHPTRHVVYARAETRKAM